MLKYLIWTNEAKAFAKHILCDCKGVSVSMCVRWMLQLMYQQMWQTL